MAKKATRRSSAKKRENPKTLAESLRLRIDSDLMSEIDSFAERLQGQRHGERVSRGEAVRILLRLGIEKETSERTAES